VIGVDSALALTRAAGGREFYVPQHRIDGDHWIARTIGLERARLLAHRYAQDTLILPMCKPLLNRIDAVALHARKWSVPQIAAKLNITSRHVRKLLRKAGVAEHDIRPERYEPDAPICPTCRRKYRRPASGAADDPAQLVLFPLIGRPQGQG
jgi:hypothetical protein